MFKIRLNKDDKRKCAWVLFKRCKFIFANNRQLYNTVIYHDNMDSENIVIGKINKKKWIPSTFFPGFRTFFPGIY